MQQDVQPMMSLGSWIHGSRAKENGQGWRYRTTRHPHVDGLWSHNSLDGVRRRRAEKEPQERWPEKWEENQ